MLSFDRFELRPDRRLLLMDGEPVALGSRAFDVLLVLAERRDRVVGKAELLDLVWPGLVVEENNLQVQISSLRKLLGQAVIATIPGSGYRFTATPLQGGVDSPATLRIPSIAVLPFVNMSDDASNEYFADGVAEELLTVLSKIRGLRVASRTSAFSFKGANVDVATVARKLNVATVLEGSVRKAGQRVRIAVQLVEAATDTRLWSQTYDRELEDIFGVQDDIARSVVKELRSLLMGAGDAASASEAVAADVRSAARGHAENAEAFRFYLQGRFLVARRKQQDMRKGIEYLKHAVRLDPGYALAWAALAYALSIEASTGWTDYTEGHGQAREAAQRSLELEPDLAEGHAVLALLRMDYDWDWKGAEASWRRALELAPGNVDVVLTAVCIAGYSGDLDECIALCRRAIALDPLSVQGLRYLGQFSLSAGYLDQAEAALQEAIELDPAGGVNHSALGDVNLAQRKFPEALAAYKKESHNGFGPLGLAVGFHALGRKAQSAAALEQLGKFPEHSYLNAKANAYCGNVDIAFDWLERAFAQRNAGLPGMKREPLLLNLHGDARWRPFLKKMGLTD
jgi:TolB-like protein/Tfp pilus assembly protein PilF